MMMMMTGRVLLVCALCVLWCGAGRVYARNPDNNSLGGYMASRGFGRNTSFLSNGSIKNLSTPLLLSASFISAMQAEAREEVSSPGVTNLPLSGATGLSPAFSDRGASIPRPTVPGLRAAIPGVDVPSDGPGAIPAPVRAADAPIPGVAVSSDGAAAFSSLGAAAAGPGPLRDPAFPGPDANIPGSVAPGHGTPIHGTAGPGAAAFSSLGTPIHDAADPGAAIPGAIPGPGSARGAAGHRPVGPGHGPGIPGHGPAGAGDGPAFSGLVPAVPGAGHSVGGGSEPPDSRSAVISSSQGGNGKTAPVSVSSDERIASPEEVLAQKGNRESGHLFARRTANGVIQH
ncbi:mucin-associated surface protein (MASP) [Trypanosoma cruzi]|nr:mucin-associated surface protein (MASP) [Trypanosoma cruzi]